MRWMRQRWVSSLLLALLLTGCWDRREIEEWNTSLATGVDVCAEGEGCRLIATRQIAIPGRIPLGGGAEGGGNSGGTGKGSTVFVLSSPGVDGSDSLRHAQSVLNRRISFGHSRIFVFSEAFAGRGLAEYLDYTRRNAGFRRLMWVVVSEGRAEAVIRAQPALERVPALFLSDMMDDATRTGRTPRVFLGEFLTRMSNKGEETIAPLIRMVDPDQPTLVGLAVFRGDRMMGKLNTEETETYQEIRGERRGAEKIDVDLPGGGRAVLAVYGRKSHQHLRWEAGKVSAHIAIELESELDQLSPGLRSSDPEVLAAIERRADAIVKQRAVALMQKLQNEYRADILGVGERVRANMPTVWDSIRDWPSAFAQAGFTFEVDLRVRRTGVATD